MKLKYNSNNKMNENEKILYFYYNFALIIIINKIRRYSLHFIL